MTKIELQVCDWVNVVSPFGVASRHKWTSNDFASNLTLSPIPIRGEDLLSNGFDSDTSGNEFFLHGDGWEIKLKNDGASYDISTIGLSTFNVSGIVSYVHELQQVLRLVGKKVIANNFML